MFAIISPLDNLWEHRTEFVAMELYHVYIPNDDVPALWLVVLAVSGAVV